MDQQAQAAPTAEPRHGPRLYTQADVSARCRLSRSHLYNLMDRGQFPAPVLRLGPKFTRWAAHEVDEWARDPQGWIDRNAPAAQGAA